MGIRTAVFAALIVVPTPALAVGYGVDAKLWMETGGTYMPNSTGGTSLPVSDTDPARQQMVNGSTPGFGFATGFIGLRTGMDIVVGDRWIFPVFDMGAYGIVGAYSDILGSVDGSIFRFHTSGTSMIDAEISGFGVRFRRRRWIIEATVKPGFAMLDVPVDVATGSTWTSINDVNAWTPTLRASLTVCHRIDPSQRFCASVTPNIYQWGWGNGGSVMLRWELGS